MPALIRAVIALLAFTSAPDLAAAADLEPGVRYAAGMRLRDPQTSISLIVPAQWEAVLPPGARSLTLDSALHPGLGLIAWRSEVAPDQLLAELSEPQALDEAYVLHPVSSPRREEDRLVAQYRAGGNCGVLVAMLGPQERALIMLLTGPNQHAAYYAQLLDELARSVRFEDTDVPMTAETPT